MNVDWMNKVCAGVRFKIKLMDCSQINLYWNVHMMINLVFLLN
jgi:hypothetical protein